MREDEGQANRTWRSLRRNIRRKQIFAWCSVLLLAFLALSLILLDHTSTLNQ
jgi:hypothetical protein